MRSVGQPLIFAQPWARFLLLLVPIFMDLWHIAYIIPTNELSPVNSRHRTRLSPLAHATTF